MKKINEIKDFLEIKELSKLEQGAVQGGAAEGNKQKQKNRQKNGGDGTIEGPSQGFEESDGN